jgi:hypothetical protein
MGLWKKLFGGGSNPSTSSSKPSRPKPSVPASGGTIISISGSAENSGNMVRAAADLEMLHYDGGRAEPFYERLSRDLVAKHGPLVSVDYVSHFPKFEIWFCYKDGHRIYSGERAGNYDIHFLTLGYIGEGPRCARHFLTAAGFDLPAEEIESIKPGDSIQRQDGKTVVVRQKDKVVESNEVVFIREEKGTHMGFPTIRRWHKSPSKAAAMAFLNKQNITQQLFQLIVETPEGTFSKDRMGVIEH